MPPDQPEALARPGNDDGNNFSVFAVHLHIAHKPKATAVADVDDLLAFQSGKTIVHALHLTNFLVAVYAGGAARYAVIPIEMQEIIC